MTTSLSSPNCAIRQDPLAVEALFDDGAPDPVRWVFARDLLAAGLDRRTGEGES